jgi:hypothetical protein
VPKFAPVKSIGLPPPSTALVAAPHGSSALVTPFQVASASPISPEMSVGPLSTVSAIGSESAGQ